MRPHVREFFNRCAAILPAPEPVVEIGAFQVPGQEAISDLRPLFPGKKYIGCDMLPGIGVDRIENIHALKFADGEVGTFLLADTLEHVADPIRGMREVHRCLRDDGAAVFTSVMHFSIHAYPNDYWRFTPEAFRMLAQDFPNVAIFYAGPELFPHTVCGVAAKAGFPLEKIEALVEPLAKITVPAPLHIQAEAAKIVSVLVGKLVGKDEQPPAAKPNVRAGFGRAGKPNWILVSGQWLDGWVAADNVAEVEIRAGQKVIHRTRLTKARPDIAETLGLAGKDAPIGFSDQVQLAGMGTIMGPLQMWIVDSHRKRQLVCESPPGIVLGDIKVNPAYLLHSFDKRGATMP